MGQWTLTAGLHQAKLTGGRGLHMAPGRHTAPPSLLHLSGHGEPRQAVLGRAALMASLQGPALDLSGVNWGPQYATCSEATFSTWINSPAACRGPCMQCCNLFSFFNSSRAFIKNGTGKMHVVTLISSAQSRVKPWLHIRSCYNVH